jgi:hypothetical protein
VTATTCRCEEVPELAPTSSTGCCTNPALLLIDRKRRYHDFIQYTPIAGRTGRAAKNGATFNIIGVGVVRFKMTVDGRERTINLTGVLHTPDLAHTLVSISALTESGCRRSWFTVEKNGIVMVGHGHGRVFETDVITDTMVHSSLCKIPEPTCSIVMWHRQCGHASNKKILQMGKHELVDGLKITDKTVPGCCEDCILGEQTR